MGNAGILIDPTDTPALTQAMIVLLRHPERRRTLRTSALTHASMFSWERAARETLIVYEETIGKSKRNEVS